MPERVALPLGGAEAEAGMGCILLAGTPEELPGHPS